MESAKRVIHFILLVMSTSFVVFIGASLYFSRDILKDKQFINLPINPVSNGNTQLTSDTDVVVGGDLTVKGLSAFKGGIIISGTEEIFGATNTGKVLSLSPKGELVLVDDKYGITSTTSVTELPTASLGGMVYFDGTTWKTASNIYNAGDNIGIFSKNPVASLHVDNNNASKIGLIVEGMEGQTASLTEWRNNTGENVASIDPHGKLSIRSDGNDHSLELYPTGNAGFLSSSGGAIFIDNTNNDGTGIGIYSNAGASAAGNMINVKVDNAAYAQAAFYMNYDGTSNAVEIVSNSTDSSSNALSVTGNNPNDSAVGFIGYETGRGTLKISHYGDGSDDNASGLSIDLKGTGTDAQGIYVDSTATGGTDGNLLRLRNQSLDRFIVSSVGSVTIGRNGTSTSITKYGNTSGDEFFVGTTGAFRVQRSATNSEAFRTQVDGDTQGRWLGTADGKLKFGDGANAQDVTISRSSAGLMLLESDLSISSRSTSNDVLTLTAYDGSNLAKISETSGGQGVLEIDDASGTVVATLRGDGGNSYISSGNWGVGSSSFGTGALNVIAIGNGTVPSTSIANGIQIYAEDVASSSELRVRDEAGNASTLSPHNFSLIPGGPSEDMAWSFYSERDDVAINVDITRALRIIENLSQEKLVFIKNLETGEELTTPSNKSNFSSEIKNLLAKVEEQEKEIKEIKESIDLSNSLISFVKKAIFKFQTIFASTVEFLASVTFKGNITVNADTGGRVSVPPHTKEFKVSFSNSFPQKPLIYLTSHNTDVVYEINDLSTNGFTVKILDPIDKQVEFEWLALLSENNNFSTLQIIESSTDSGVVKERFEEENTDPSVILESEIIEESSASSYLHNEN